MKPEARLSNVRRFHSRSGRLIEVNNTKWKWTCGSGGGVKLYAEDGRVITTNAWTIKGIRPDDFDRGKWKGTSNGALYPGEIAMFLKDE